LTIVLVCILVLWLFKKWFYDDLELKDPIKKKIHKKIEDDED